MTSQVTTRASRSSGSARGEFATAFFLHDNYEFLETWTRRDTGEFVTISGNGLMHETKATHVSGTIFEFTSINAGQPFVVRDSDGNLILRDRGVIRQVIQFDTLGDDVPGGAFVADVSFSVDWAAPGTRIRHLRRACLTRATFGRVRRRLGDSSGMEAPELD